MNTESYPKPQRPYKWMNLQSLLNYENYTHSNFQNNGDETYLLVYF